MQGCLSGSPSTRIFWGATEADRARLSILRLSRLPGRNSSEMIEMFALSRLPNL